ncbi:Diapolycopene oxygenase [Streptomyces sp. RB5]|uniref:Diapolycopene oxygenase n=1 Tax=Streptomyces smaragdinus TaxID=2585196 RepID=A0A7K0CP58_9ACTN|nr:NAD(P)/FAD-dependent oxidoreductase [Streptomyces smaragdinus]MQY15268.1 Diapolycopene oxygenase [Streptomyces smaragdinus]
MAGIAVIGAGLGAMAAAARLATAGHRVTVYERGDTYGGAVRSLTRDGFGFDTGPGLLRLPAVYRDLFVKTGRRALEDVVGMTALDPAVRHVFPDGTAVTLPASRGGVIRALDAGVAPGAGQEWADLVNRGRTVWDATRRPLLEEPLTGDWRALAADPYPPVEVRGGLLRRRRTVRARTLEEVRREQLGDPRLGLMLTEEALSYGFDPLRAPAAAVVLPYLRQTFGSWYVNGGTRALATAVYERCLERRVEFVFGAAVTGLVTADGRAAGVRLADGGTRAAAHVVAGVSPAALEALGGAAPGPTPQEEASGRVGMPGRVVVCLALRGGREPDAVHRTVVHGAAREAEAAWVFRGGLAVDAPTVTVLRPDDPGRRPDGGHEAVTLSAVVPTGEDWGKADVAGRFADAMVRAAEAAVPGLGGRTLWREVRTPADTERETGAVGGGVPGPALAGAGGAYLTQGNTTALPGLYAVGGWSHPGGGLAHAGMSGALVAGLIVEGADFRGSQ